MGNYPRLVIAGLRGGSGKTTLSLGLVRALRGRGLSVVPFKKGPDYIDAGWLASAAGCPCYNLDPYLVGRNRVLHSFIEHSSGADVAIVEGNRGLFDGVDEEGSYSTAEVAKILRSPVILVIDCTKVTRTVAALVLGAEKFDPELLLKGVILNQIAGSRHETVIRKSIERYCNVPVVGSIPKLDAGLFPERHMGLLPQQEHQDTEKALSFVEKVAAKYINVDILFAIAREAESIALKKEAEGGRRRGVSVGPPPETGERKGYAICPETRAVRVGVIRDSAFQFYYPENFEELRRSGAEIVEVSALDEKQLPEVDALYIGGGFPETHAITLAENVNFRDSLRKEIENGLPVYAECGGFMYLGKGLLLDEKTYPMAGIFPMVFSLDRKPQAHGYSVVEVVRKNPFYSEGTALRGHEFHYSRACGDMNEIEPFYYAFRMKRGHGIYNKMDGICYKNVLATYTHLHAFGAQEWTEGVIRQAVEYKTKKALRMSTNGG
ncbi:MAG TPA: cobyrinate a,c-diamide synthase [Thermodesulfovibrionales bacterium]|nr:cobyrinate a,c-diamide synthase [Thermodesulfovibrionales bacterium]